MTNRERYQRAFGTLRASGTILTEAETMGKRKKRRFVLPRAAVAALLVCGLALGSLSAAYAADIGGFRQTVKIWLGGSLKDAELEVDEQGAYTVSAEGEVVIEGTAAAMDENGETAPVDPEALAQGLVESGEIYEEAGRVWLGFCGSRTDVTDRFDADGICRITAENSEGITEYFVIVKTEEGYYFTQTRDGWPELPAWVKE